MKKYFYAGIITMVVMHVLSQAVRGFWEFWLVGFVCYCTSCSIQEYFTEIQTKLDLILEKHKEEGVEQKKG